MTGRELMIYILENNLEDEPVIENGRIIGLKSIEEVAVEMKYGVETVKALVDMGALKGVKIDGGYYILK